MAKPSKISKELPLIAQIPFKDLERAPASVEITPIACKTCGAVLMDIGAVKNDANLGVYFTCQFCGTINKLGAMPGQLPGGGDIEFVLERAGTKVEPEGKKKGLSGELVTSVIDISGSMSGGKLEAVKHNLVESLKDMAVNAKSSVFMLVTFESNVEIFFSPKETAMVISDDKLLRSEKDLKAYIEKNCKKFDPQPVEKLGDSWLDQVRALYTKGSTALGPALAAGVFIFLARKASGRILLLTDGLANVGFGRLEGDGTREGRGFYENMAKVCLENNIVVDVIGVGGGNELALDVLGKLSEYTGGELFFVTEAELDSTFSELTQRQFIGKDVKVKVFTTKDIEVEQISGISSVAQKTKRLEEVNIGSVTADREAFIEFNVKQKLEGDQVPVQVQMEYKDAAGNKKLRVFKTTLKAEENEADYKKNYDPKLMSVMRIQQAGEVYGKGDTVQAQQILAQTKQVFEAERAMFGEENAAPAMEFLASEMEQIDDFEREKLTKAKASFSAMAGQKRARVSLDKKMKELKK
ncbi:MAG: VWA domain-containing protein [Candidatus Lokiarchaeota archaeon]|nr:VWA domain-containing protein [Candidatus Lokiarchaeota archaeon]